MADAVPVSGPGGAADDCGECDHSPAAHTEGEDPVSPGVCAECPDGEDTHDYLPPRGAADGNESTAGPDAHTDQADELRPLRIPDHTVNEEQGVLHAPTDRAALRERIAEALYEHDHPGWRVSLRESDTEPVYQTRAAAVLPLFAGHDSPATVPPAPADQTAPLTLVDNLIEHCPDHGCVEPEWEDGCHCEIVPLLRRVADAVPVSGPGGAADEASSYAERVNAPLSEATVNALRERLASGGVPVRTVRRRVADETRQPEPAFAPGMPCEHGCRAAANELTRETQQAPCGRSSTMPTPCSAGDHCCTGPSKAQQPAAVAQPDGEA
jgi:hypothetical protein